MTREDKIFQLAKGYRGRSKNCYRLAARRVEKGLQHAYRSRRLKKREARETWIMQIRAASMEHQLPYSRLIHGLMLANVGLDRKMLALLAQQEPYSFRAIVEEAKQALRNSILNTPDAGPPEAEGSDKTVGVSGTAAGRPALQGVASSSSAAVQLSAGSAGGLQGPTAAEAQDRLAIEEEAERAQAAVDRAAEHLSEQLAAKLSVRTVGSHGS